MAKREGRKSKTKRVGRVSEAASDGPESVETVVFRSGNSDAVRLPKRFGLVGKKVHVHRESPSRIVIELKTKRSWPTGFWEQFSGVDYGLRRPPDPPSDPDPRMERLIKQWNGEEE